MEILIFNPLGGATTSVQPAGRAAGAWGNQSFAKHMSRHLPAGRNGSDLLGAPGKAAAAQGPPSEKSGRASRADECRDLAGLLSEFMQQLQSLAAEKETGPGAWAFSLPDSGLLQELGKNAGMTAGDVARLNGRLAQEGQLGLADFLGIMAAHFTDLSQSKPVIAPETDLPLLETLLARMGLPIEQINLLAEKAVVADGSLDLTIFTAELEQLRAEDGAPVTLSSWEAGQLRRMLAAAGVSGQSLQEIFPEPWSQAAAGDTDEQLGLGRLQSVLRQSLAAVDSSRPVADVPAFLADLDQILAQAGFQDRRVGWSPAVQQTAESIYRKLLESVDLATVRIEKISAAELDAFGNGLAKEQERHDAVSLLPGEEDAAWKGPAEPGSGKPDSSLAKAGAAGVVTGTAGSSRNDASGGPAVGREAVSEIQQQASSQIAGGMGKGLQDSARHAEGQIAGKNPAEAGSAGIDLSPAEVIAGEAGSGAGVKESDGPGAAPTGRPAPGVPQQVASQVMTGVLKGLQSNEHHLVLKLFPRELGEVKVEMLVRNEQVSLAITAENNRVKEVLENSLGQFRDNLERQGFTLGECMVSVDQQEDAGEAWQRFMLAWKEQQKGARRPGEGSSPHLAGDVFAAQRPGRGNSFNIII